MKDAGVKRRPCVTKEFRGKYLIVSSICFWKEIFFDLLNHSNQSNY